MCVFVYEMNICVLRGQGHLRVTGECCHSDEWTID